MRSSILLGLVFIGDNIGRGLHAELKGDPTSFIALALSVLFIMDILELRVRGKHE